MHHNVNLSWLTSLHISTKTTTHPTKYGNGWYGVILSLKKASSCFFATTKRSKIVFICRPSTILVVKASALRSQGKYSKICHHRECIKKSTCLGLPFSTKATTHRTKYGNGWYGVSSSLNAASSCFFATTKRSKIVFICRPSTILVVKLPHCVLRANIQKMCHHRECIKKSTCLGLPFSTKARTHRTKYGNGWYGLSSSLNAASSCFFCDNQAIQNHVNLQTLNDLGGKASALRAQGKYSEDLQSQGMHHNVKLSWPTILHKDNDTPN